MSLHCPKKIRRVWACSLGCTLSWRPELFCVQSVGLDASSTGSRIDVVVIALSAVLLMTGLQWLALKPAVKDPVCPLRLPSLLCKLTVWEARLLLAGPLRKLP